MKEDKLDIHQCLDFMQMWYRDVLMYKTTKDINLLIFKDEFSHRERHEHGQRLRGAGAHTHRHRQGQESAWMPM